MYTGSHKSFLKYYVYGRNFLKRIITYLCCTKGNEIHVFQKILIKMCFFLIDAAMFYSTIRNYIDSFFMCNTAQQSNILSCYLNIFYGHILTPSVWNCVRVNMKDNYYKKLFNFDVYSSRPEELRYSSFFRYSLDKYLTTFSAKHIYLLKLKWPWAICHLI